MKDEGDRLSLTKNQLSKEVKQVSLKEAKENEKETINETVHKI